MFSNSSYAGFEFTSVDSTDNASIENRVVVKSWGFEFNPFYLITVLGSSNASNIFSVSTSKFCTFNSSDEIIISSFYLYHNYQKNSFDFYPGNYTVYAIDIDYRYFLGNVFEGRFFGIGLKFIYTKAFQYDPNKYNPDNFGLSEKCNSVFALTFSTGLRYHLFKNVYYTSSAKAGYNFLNTVDNYRIHEEFFNSKIISDVDFLKIGFIF